PYTEVYQSGVLFLGYSFGLPAVATAVGAFDDDILEGRTGYVAKPKDSADLARALETFFKSDLFQNLDRRRQEIRDYARAKNSWEIVGAMTRDVYAKLLER